jgi:hypothetical protein
MTLSSAQCGIRNLFDSYESEEVALNTGQILKEMLRHEALARILLYSDE